VAAVDSSVVGPGVISRSSRSFEPERLDLSEQAEQRGSILDEPRGHRLAPLSSQTID
jgi:hypothetical protein